MTDTPVYVNAAIAEVVTQALRDLATRIPSRLHSRLSELLLSNELGDAEQVRAAIQAFATEVTQDEARNAD